MPTVNEINNYFMEKIPYSMKEDFDNVGFLAGNAGNEVTRVLTALDITSEVIEEARRLGAQLIVSHHPLIFFAAKSVTTVSTTGRKVYSLLKNDISAICLHTNLDCVQGGVNDELMRVLGGRVIGILGEAKRADDGSEYGLGRIGELDKAMSFGDFLTQTKNALSAKGLRYYNAGCEVKRIGVLGGSGGNEIAEAIACSCDTYISGDIKHDNFLEAMECGINLIDAGHFPTENIVIPLIKKMLFDAFPSLEVKISETCHQTECYFV